MSDVMSNFAEWFLDCCAAPTATSSRTSTPSRRRRRAKALRITATRRVPATLIVSLRLPPVPLHYATKKTPRHEASAFSGRFWFTRSSRSPHRRRSTDVVPGPRHAVGPRTFALPVTAERQRNPCNLSDAPRMRDQVANLRQHTRSLHVVELFGELRHLRDERVRHQLVDFFLSRWSARPQQFRHRNRQRVRQPCQRRQCRRRLFVLDLRDVGAGNSHAQCQLALA